MMAIISDDGQRSLPEITNFIATLARWELFPRSASSSKKLNGHKRGLGRVVIEGLSGGVRWRFRYGALRRSGVLPLQRKAHSREPMAVRRPYRSRLAAHSHSLMTLPRGS